MLQLILLQHLFIEHGAMRCMLAMIRGAAGMLNLGNLNLYNEETCTGWLKKSKLLILESMKLMLAKHELVSQNLSQN